MLVHDLGKASSPAKDLPRHIAHEHRSVRLARRVSERLRVPQDCRDIAELTARHHGTIHRAAELRPATTLDLLMSMDALRRPERLEMVLAACAADACSRPGKPQEYVPAQRLREALAAIKAVNAGAIAREMAGKAEPARRDDAIASAVRAARLAALKRWKAQMR